MPSPDSAPRTTAPEATAPKESAESGVALILVLIFSILLYIIVAELVTTGRTARLVGENAALLSRMRNHLEYTLTQVEQVLIDDLAAAAAEGGGDGGIPGLGGGGDAPGLPGGLGGGGEGGGEGEAGADPAASADSSQDAWYPSTPYAEGDITTYAMVEDENRKFNILAMVSKDQEFAKESVDRFTRLIDALREDTDFDVDSSTARRMSTEIVEWMQARQRNPDGMPRPPLKSDEPSFDSISVPLHLDELMALNTVTPELFYDLVFDNRVNLGLESVLTIWTSTSLDPGDPEKNRRREQRTNRDTASSGAGATPGEEEGGDGGGEAGGEPSEPGDPNDPESELTPEGLGIKININTASWPVLRCLVDRSEISDSVIEALLRYRNEEAETEEEGGEQNYDTQLLLGEEPQKQVFADLAALEEVEEWANLANLEAKEKFLSMLTTTSDVFTVHLASIFKRNEERRVYVIRKARTIFRREEGGDAGAVLIPLGPILEVRHGVRVMPIDFQDEVDYGSQYLESEMDYFAQEERIWDPFRLEFYMTEEHRSQFFERR